MGAYGVLHLGNFLCSLPGMKSHDRLEAVRYCILNCSSSQTVFHITQIECDMTVLIHGKY
jgi:hypothetical protein